jgi:hypothetical protein
MPDSATFPTFQSDNAGVHPNPHYSLLHRAVRSPGRRSSLVSVSPPAPTKARCWSRPPARPIPKRPGRARMSSSTPALP